MRISTETRHTDIAVLSQSPVVSAITEAGGGISWDETQRSAAVRRREPCRGQHCLETP